MKKVLTEQDINAEHRAGKSQLFCDAGTILTPSAKDAIKKYGMEVVQGECCSKEQTGSTSKTGKADADFDLTIIKKMAIEQIQRENINLSEQNVDTIVQEILKRVEQAGSPSTFLKEEDKSGIRLIRGNTVICEPFDTGKPNDKVGLIDILTTKESPNMATGFMTFEKSAFDWTLGYDEVDYIIEGNLNIVVNGKTYHGYAGDVFFIPMGTSITFSVPEYCKFFYATYPANWQELSGK